MLLKYPSRRIFNVTYIFFLIKNFQYFFDLNNCSNLANNLFARLPKSSIRKSILLLSNVVILY